VELQQQFGFGHFPPVFFLAPGLEPEQAVVGTLEGAEVRCSKNRLT
jgi:hypothetical protein